MRAPRATPRRAFTLIELLVVIGIIALLVSIVLVAGSGALASSKKTQTERLLRTVSSALEQFKSDHGFYPPLLNPASGAPGAEVVVSEAAQNAFAADQELEIKRYYSVHSLTAYLVGVGDLNADGREVYDDNNPATNGTNEINLDDGADGPGLRAPGADLSWGGARGRVASYPPPASGPTIPTQQGRVYGPYIDVGQGKNLRVELKDPALTPDQHARRGMVYLVDRWDRPIRYYRHWPTKARSGVNQGRDSLREIPIELLSDAAMEEFAENRDASPALDQELMGAPYALLSAGEDGFFGEALDEGRTNAMPLMAHEFYTGVGDAKDRKKIMDRMKDNVRVTP